MFSGKGKFQEFVAPGTGEKVYTPYEVFNITSGRRYRFRVISNGILNCPIQFSIDNHTLGVFESDGNPFKKIEVESFNIFAGERFDFVLNADQPIGNYWMRVRGMADCGVKKAHQQAILRYNGASETEPTSPVGYEHGFRDGKVRCYYLLGVFCEQKALGPHRSPGDIYPMQSLKGQLH